MPADYRPIICRFYHIFNENTVTSGRVIDQHVCVLMIPAKKTAESGKSVPPQQPIHPTHTFVFPDYNLSSRFLPPHSISTHHT